MRIHREANRPRLRQHHGRARLRRRRRLALLYLLGNPERCTVEGLCTCFGNADIGTVDGKHPAPVRRMGTRRSRLSRRGRPEDADTPAARFLAGICAAAPGRGIGPRHGRHDQPARRPALRSGVLRECGRPHLHGRHHGKPRHQRTHHGRAEPVLRSGGHPRRTGLPGRRHHRLRPELPAGPRDPRTDRTFLLRRTPGSPGSSTTGSPTWASTTPGTASPSGTKVAAAALIKPELFEPREMDVALDERMLSVGYLEPAPAGAPRATVSVPSSPIRRPISPTPWQAGAAAASGSDLPSSAPEHSKESP